jgi:hypothetical protein
MTLTIYETPNIIAWTQSLLDSYYTLVGKQLIPRKNNPMIEAKEVFLAPFVVVSHGTETDPIFNYGNQIALELWEMSWEQFTQTPSRYSAETEQRETREAMLKMAQQQGYIHNYQGIRISNTGKRFQLEQAIIWNVFDEHKKSIGQAATIPQWEFIDS